MGIYEKLKDEIRLRREEKLKEQIRYLKSF